jgi:hypothetical protein
MPKTPAGGVADVRRQRSILRNEIAIAFPVRGPQFLIWPGFKI